MIRNPWVTVFVFSVFAAAAEDSPTKVVGPVADGTPAEPAPPPQKLEVAASSILETKVCDVGGRKITMQRIKPVALPDPPPPIPTPDISDTDAQSPERVVADHPELVMSFISATVYDHGMTFVRWWPEGDMQREMAGWSNLDFNHFCGFSSFLHEGKNHMLVMALGNVDTEGLAERMALRGRDYVPPAAPEIPADGPAFVVTEGEAEAPGALDLMDGLHALYRVEGERLRLAHEGRERARLEQEASLIANPPQPKDIVLRYWRTGGKSVKLQAKVKP